MDQGEIPTPSGNRGIVVASGLSAQTDPVKAAAAACDECLIQLAGAPCDLAFVFFTSHHVERAADISAKVRTRLRPIHTIGVSAESVAGATTELERTPGLSILALSLPGARLSAFTSDSFPPLDATEPEHVAVLSGGIGAATDTAAVFVFADPFSIPALQLIPALNKARQRDDSGKPAGIVFGGLASAARAPGGNALFHNDRVLRFGAVGVTISGPVIVDALVSQGCRPVATPMVITKARNNLILQLGGRPARDVMREVVTDMNPEERAALSSGLFVGRVINEYKDRFGRSDFLIRAVVGEDPGSGAIAVADFVRVGQTVQFHVRDADTAAQDLGLLLDSQRLHDRPAGAMLVSCNGRGTRLFSKPNHDAESISRAFAAVRAGEQLAKPGSMILPSTVPAGAWSSTAGFPLAGFFASGEIGPVGADSYLHGNTACVALFRAKV
ncbi:MAG: FIST C-terminal domain-containing protein [Phycisphaerales bacterium]|nr:FIST C-terminal domain-containing protein [Phycisphaerales bacterium]